MTCKAYYNENDKLAARWLRELVAFNLIAPGDVDERSIEEVKAEDLRGYTQHHFFAGIGVWSYALRNAGWTDDFPVWTGSCPCQSFSASGQRKGFDDSRHLWPAWFRLIRELQPHVVIGEQVSKKDGLAWLDVVCADMEAEAYTIGALDTSAAGVGAPHIRSRLYWVAESRRGVRSPWGEGNEQESEAAVRAGSAGHGKKRVAESDKARRSIEREARAHHQWSLWDNVDRCGEHGSVADTECDGRRTDEQRRGSQERIVDGRISASELADTASDHGRPGKRGAETGIRTNGKRRRRSAGGGNDDVLGDSIGERSQGHAGDGDRREGSQAAAERSTAATGASLGLGHTSSEGRRENNRGALSDEETDGRESHGDHIIAGSVTNFWSNIRWLYCSDGRYRPFPAEPTILPLAPRTAGRVGLLRGAGNALCAPQAEAFIRAYMTP